MSKFKIQPIDFARLKTVPLSTRGGKVRVEDFASPYTKGGGVSGWLDSLPKILAGVRGPRLFRVQFHQDSPHAARDARGGSRCDGSLLGRC